MSLKNNNKIENLRFIQCFDSEKSYSMTTVQVLLVYKNLFIIHVYFTLLCISTLTKIT